MTQNMINKVKQYNFGQIPSVRTSFVHINEFNYLDFVAFVNVVDNIPF